MTPESTVNLLLSKFFHSKWVQRILLFLVCAAAVGLCWLVWQAANGEYDPQPVVVVLTDEVGEEYLSADAFNASGYIVQQMEPDSDELPTALQELLLSEDFALKAAVIATESGSRTGELAIRLLQRNVPVVMAGPAPGRAVLQNPMAWYVGIAAAGGGEAMGDALAVEFRDGILPDLNDDHLLQYIAFGEGETRFSEEFLSAFLLECEHYGVYNSAVGRIETEDPKTVSLSAVPELILFGGPDGGEDALALAAEQGLLASETPTLVAGFAMTEDKAKTLVAAGAEAAVYYDIVTVTRTVRTLVHNLAAEEAPLVGLDIPADGQQFHIPLLLYEG